MVKVVFLTLIATFIFIEKAAAAPVVPVASIAPVSPVTPTNVAVPVAVPVPSNGEMKIEGIDDDNMKKLNDELKDVKEPEERKEKIDDWVEDLPEEQQPIAKQYFQNMELKNAAPVPPLTPIASAV